MRIKVAQQIQEGEEVPKVGRTSSRSKREKILASATEHFGHDGYEDTKWADIATDVGLGSTALYHYFESKLHCLFDIMSDTIHGFRTAFDDITSSESSFADAYLALWENYFDLTDAEVYRFRVLVAEQGRLSQARSSEREEKSRQVARQRMRDLERAWDAFLAKAMENAEIPQANRRLMTLAILGLYNSVWDWYRPGGSINLVAVKHFYVPRLLALVGLDPQLANR